MLMLLHPEGSRNKSKDADNLAEVVAGPGARSAATEEQKWCENRIHDKSNMQAQMQGNTLFVHGHVPQLKTAWVRSTPTEGRAQEA